MRRLLPRALLALLALALAVAAAAAEHKVRKGETLTEIADRYGVSVAELKSANRISNPNKIRVGQALVIPASAARPPEALVDYVVRKGDSLSVIAKRAGISPSQLARINNLRDADKIRIGQVLKVPSGGRAAPAVAYAALDPAVLDTLRAVSAKRGQWKRIVIHHSGSPSGSAKAFDRFHREERRMENGLAYHFVIGNGRGMGDGEIFVGDRWRKQIEGGHLASRLLNQISIGICLVGNFEKSPPSRRQMEQLEALVAYLLESARLEPESVTTHTLIHPKHTLCPGRRFPTESFLKKLGARR